MPGRRTNRHTGRMRQKSASFSDAFALVVKSRREAAGLSRAGLARLAELHQTYIGLLERGDRSPNVDTAKAIAEALGTTLATMIEESEHDFRRVEKQKIVKK